MTKFYLNLLAFVLITLFTSPLFAQCNINVGADDTITCGTPKQLSIDCDWKLVSSNNTNQLNSIYFPSSTLGFACGNLGTILKTTNAGSSFQAITSSYSSNLNKVYFTSTNIGYCIGTNGLLLKTQNGGNTWDSVNTNTTNNLYAIYFTSAAVGFIAGQNTTLLKTTDSGSTWVNSSSGINLGTETINDIFFIDNLVGYATVNGTIYKTINGGNSWVLLTSAMTVTYKSIAFLNKDTGFVCGNAGVYFVIKTTDGGDTWQQVYSTNSAPFSQIVIDTDKNVLLAGAGIWKSSDLGKNWQYINSANPTAFSQNGLRFYGICGNNQNPGIVVGSSGTIYKNQLIDSIVWYPALDLNNSTVRNPLANPTTSTTYSVTAKVDGCVAYDDITIYVNPLQINGTPIYYVSCGDSIQLKTTINTTSSNIQYNWTPTTYLSTSTNSSPIAVIQKNTSYQVKVSTPNGCVDSMRINALLNFDVSVPEQYNAICGNAVQIIPNTSKWGLLNKPTTENITQIQFINANVGFIGGANFLYKTNDGGQTWSTNLLTNYFTVNKILFRTELLGYVAINDNNLMRNVIKKTTDGGQTWTTLDPVTNYYITDLFFVSDLVGYATANPGKILKTTNGGNSWIATNSGVSQSLAGIWFTSASVGYAVGDSNLLKTTNGGTSWFKVYVNSSLQLPHFNTITFLNADTGYISSELRTWKTTNAGLTWVEQTISNATYNFAINHIAFINTQVGYAACYYFINGGAMNGYGALYKTENGGQLWSRVLGIDSSLVLKKIALINNNEKAIVAGNAGSLYKTLLAPQNYAWQPSIGLNNVQFEKPIATPTATTQYILTASVGNCQVTDTTQVIVTPIKISAGGTQQIVCGDSILLTPKTLYLNIDASRYQSYWNITDSANNIVLASKPNITTQGYFNLPAGKYTFTCKPQVIPPPLFIKIIPLHSDSIVEDIFYTSDTIITREFIIPNYHNYQFTWQPQATRISPTSTPTNYILTMQTPQGCIAHDTALIIPTALTLKLGNDKMLTCGQRVMLDTFGVNSNQQLQIHWSNSSILNDSNSRNPLISPTDSIQLVTRISGSNGCTASDTVKFFVTPIWVNGFDTLIGCHDTAMLRLNSNYVDTLPLQYTWNPKTQLNNDTIANPKVIGTQNTTYQIKIKTWNGCLATDSVKVWLAKPSAPSICIVGVNDITKNQIIWNKNAGKYVDFYTIKKETNITGQYNAIGQLRDTQALIFIDTASNPLIQANQYRLQYTDVCGIESYESESHQTMHLTINKGIGNSWNLIWNSYKGFTVTTYNIYRGTTPNNLQLIGTSAGSNTSYSDLDAPAGDVYYQVEIISPNACSPNKTYNTSRSNKVSNNDVGLSSNDVYNQISAYPNPSNSLLYLSSTQINLSGASVIVTDLLGRVVMEEVLTQPQINVAALNNGSYLILVNQNNKQFRLRFIKQ
jgi:photosystem II stability/assembly factor-like uncharacterized protein